MTTSKEFIDAIARAAQRTGHNLILRRPQPSDLIPTPAASCNAPRTSPRSCEHDPSADMAGAQNLLRHARKP